MGGWSPDVRPGNAIYQGLRWVGDWDLGVGQVMVYIHGLYSKTLCNWQAEVLMIVMLIYQTPWYNTWQVGLMQYNSVSASGGCVAGALDVGLVIVIQLGS